MLKDDFKKELFDAVIKIETYAECDAFFDDLLTKKELEAMTQRLRAAALILEGKTYEQIIKETQISSATLSRISTCIKYGKGGYKDILLKEYKKGTVKK